MTGDKCKNCSEHTEQPIKANTSSDGIVSFCSHECRREYMMKGADPTEVLKELRSTDNSYPWDDSG